jgi:putative CocE/NonD family hydrolase
MNAEKPVGSEPSYTVLVEKNVKVPLRDGVCLATDLYFPAVDGRRADGTFPVVLSRTPYGKGALSPVGQYFAERGYVAAMQDVRGRHSSEGSFYAFRHEAPDGYDTVEWLAAQPWCNGKVGTHGQSYCAAVQSALACLAPPHLSAMIVTFGPSSYYHSSMRHNGVLELRFFTYAFSMAASSKEALADPRIKEALDDAQANVWDWVKAYPLRPGNSPLALVPAYEQWCLDICSHAAYDEYWKIPGYGPQPFYDRHADVPTLYVGGWYDTYTRGTLENFREQRKRQKNPVHVLMGPWIHGGVGGRSAGDASFDPEGNATDLRAIQLQWFDQWLKGLPAGAAEAPPVKYFVMGGGGIPDEPERRIAHGGTWKTAAAWPPPGATPTPMYLHADGVLRTNPPETELPPTVYRFDPADPVPTIGGQLSAIPVPAGGYDQRNDPRFPTSRGTLPLSSRRDALCFVTPPLEQPVEVAGPIQVNLWVSTDGLDTDFTAKLIDWYPPTASHPAGCALGIADSVARLRFRNGYEREELAVAGEVYALRFEMYPTANLCLLSRLCGQAEHADIV